MNFLMICTDQFRWDCLGYMNRYPIHTPNLDALAKESVRFTEAYCTLPSCCPARQSIICGKLPEKLGALWNYDISFPVSSIQKEEFSWAREFQKNGYKTSYIGKWHVSPTATPLDFGYDEYFSEWDLIQEMRKDFPDYSWQCGWQGEISEIPSKKSLTHRRVAHALDFLYSNKSEPFHLRLDFPEPHLPCRPSREFTQMYNASDIPPWEGFGDSFENKPYIQRQMVRNWQNGQKDWKEFSESVALYYSIITQIDDAIGILIQTLKDLGLYENTVILFTADHGDMCGSHQMTDKHYVMYDDIVRVPMIMRIPGVSPLECSDYVINSLDIAPTICELFGFDVETEFDGMSLLSAIHGEKYCKRDCVVSSFNGQQFGLYTLRMLKQGNMKYVWNPVDTDELYDLSVDSGEHCNLVHSENYAEILHSMRLKLYKELKKNDDPIVRGDWVTSQLLEGNQSE